jgi:hypothetical protein
MLLISCVDGYQKTSDNEWTWVNKSEAGQQVKTIDTDVATFTILDDPAYAKDKKNVFCRGIRILDADPETFEVITENGYSKDKNNVYLDRAKVIFANPNAFEIIQWPYAKDDKRVFNGNLPIEVDNINEFEVIKAGKGKSFYTKALFMKWNEDFIWLDSLNVNGIIIDESAEARTENQRFKGVNEVK